MKANLKLTFSSVVSILTLTACGGGSESVELTSTGGTETVYISGEVTQALPNNITLNENLPVSFQFKNESNLEATSVNLDYQFPANATDINNTCPDVLAAQATCDISAMITSDTPEKITFDVTFSYAEGEAIELQTSGVSGDVAVTGEMTKKIGNQVTVNTNYPVTFTFTNENSLGSEATGIQTDVSLLSRDEAVAGAFTETSNSCKDSLASSASCEIQGTINIADTRPLNLTASLSYDQGEDVVLSTDFGSSSLETVDDIIIDSAVDELVMFNYSELPKHLEYLIYSDTYQSSYQVYESSQIDTNVKSFINSSTWISPGQSDILVNLGGTNVNLQFGKKASETCPRYTLNTAASCAGYSDTYNIL